MRSRTLAVIGVALCILLGACGSSQPTGGGNVPTATPAQTTPVPTSTPAPATATRAASSPIATRATPSAGVPFTIIYDSGMCGLGRLDTTTGTFARKIKADGPAQVVTIVLSEQELAAIRQKVEAIRFFDYPERFAVTPPPGSPVSLQIPSIAYTFTVQLDGRVKTVTWNDKAGGATSADADRLRELARLIEQIVTARPEFQQLPQPEFGCL